MRKLIALLAVSVVTVSALAQGTVNFNNNVWTGTSSRPVFAPDGVTRLVGTDYVAQLYFGTVGTPAASLQPIGNVGRFRVVTTASPGTWSGSTITLPGIAAGQTAALQVRVWNATLFPAGYAAAVAGGGIRGASGEFSYTVPAGSTPAPNEFWMANFGSFTLVVPEPSTIALGVVGLAGLLFLRRRK